jgi:DNA-binding CsgD family transcriptional regulator
MSEKWPQASREFLDILGVEDYGHLDLSLNRVKEDVLKALVNMFHADSAGFFMRSINSPSFLEGQQSTVINLGRRYTKQYIDHYHRMDPFLRVVPGAIAYRDTDLMLPAEFQKLEWYCDFLKPQHVYHTLDMYLQCDRQLLGYIGILRDNARSVFSQNDLIKARYLARSFSQKIKKCRQKEKFSGLEQLLKQVCDLSSEGIIILTQGLCPVYWNSSAEEMGLSLGRRVWKSQTQSGYWPLLPPEVLEECDRFRISLQNDKEISNGNNRGKVLYIGQGPELKVRIEKLSTQNSPAENSEVYYFLLTLHEVHRSYGGMDLVPPVNRKLTAREWEIVHFIRQGLTNREIGNTLCVSLPTVATHVRHIFEKLGIGSRAKLIRETELEGGVG